ncbi:tetratricopeptide repeat protein [Quatrionicoccus australiensis]|uniref:tetratricopeptide repeat protein n=1 Tax=Quatrionicoccus australiensis TaxID=138118 RepID=UPI001CFA77F2|nr:tetratricopeptide repeat protein [Quatrionicoccus australiensis]MCB4358844.1 tetratricopeptide repeat protein [Quatrionicoccus australiensis]
MLGFILRLVAALWLGGASAAPAGPGYIGNPACAACHAEAARAWQGSHHAHSMQPATPQSVLGDFADASFEQHGQRSRFFRRGGKFWVNTQGPDGRVQDFEIRYTFGIEPLQQYLIALPGGRLQAFSLAWDSRPHQAGGQRWYALYPDNPPAPGDPTHWSGRDQNWNFMCASCHSTGLDKNFDLGKNSYATRWAEISVGCESCHGPGARHRDWARGKRSGDNGLIALAAMNSLAWRFTEPGQKIARPQGDVAAAKEASEACYGCHSRRQELLAKAEPGARFLDNYLPRLLEPTLYHADGQIDGEVFEYGSFMQSRMQAAGVTCSNCHQTHSLKLRAEGNALCAQCHRSEHYDRSNHHHHAEGSAGALCTSCHMPQKTYMGVDVRHDHGFRIPDPTLAGGKLPNTCGQCHAERDRAWASEQLQRWTAGKTTKPPHFASALGSGSDSLPALSAALGINWSGIVRASALNLLRGAATRESAEIIATAANDADDLVRLGAARALPTLPGRAAATLAGRLLADPRRAVRIEAARSLAGIPGHFLPPETAARLQAALGELETAELAAGERPESHFNLAQLHARQGKASAAEQAYRSALRLAPDFSPARLGLTDLYRMQGRDQEGEKLLRQAVDRPEVANALGLLLIRQARLGDALPWLAQAAAGAPENPGFALTHALALAESGNREGARAVLDDALRLHPQAQSLRVARHQLTEDHTRN